MSHVKNHHCCFHTMMIWHFCILAFFFSPCHWQSSGIALLLHIGQVFYLDASPISLLHSQLPPHFLAEAFPDFSNLNQVTQVQSHANWSFLCGRKLPNLCLCIYFQEYVYNIISPRSISSRSPGLYCLRLPLCSWSPEWCWVECYIHSLSWNPWKVQVEYSSSKGLQNLHIVRHDPHSGSC